MFLVFGLVVHYHPYSRLYSLCLYCSITYFSPVLWPDFSLWQLLLGVFFFQRQQSQLERLLDGDKVELSTGLRKISQRPEMAPT